MSRTPHRLSGASFDALLALVLAVGALALGFAVPGDRALDPLGTVLLLSACAVLPWRRVRPGLVLILVLATTVPYHILDYQHEAASPVALVALATYASRVARIKALIIGVAVVVTAATIMGYVKDGAANGDHLGAAGWIFFSVVAGQAWRIHHAYIASIIDRAERAERAREEEVRRRVAEERLRIARDLHDLLAHSITLIGVQAGVAAHLARQPRPDGAVLAEALETIADSCRDARAEVRAALTVLRDDGEAPEHGAVPGLAGVWDLAASVRRTGVDVTVTLGAAIDDLAPAVGVAAYRIVQEALTNVVRHAGAGRVTVGAVRENGTLLLTVSDDGHGRVGGGVRLEAADTGASPGPASGPSPASSPGPPSRASAASTAVAGTAVASTTPPPARPADGARSDGPGGFGIIGMAERARSVGGTLTAEPGESGGFTVRAVLPLPEVPPQTGPDTTPDGELPGTAAESVLPPQTGPDITPDAEPPRTVAEFVLLAEVDQAAVADHSTEAAEADQSPEAARSTQPVPSVPEVPS